MTPRAPISRWPAPTSAVAKSLSTTAKRGAEAAAEEEEGSGEEEEEEEDSEAEGEEIAAEVEEEEGEAEIAVGGPRGVSPKDRERKLRSTEERRRGACVRACEIYTYVRYACVNGHVAKACLNSFSCARVRVIV